jgi:hypothetical protein
MLQIIGSTQSDSKKQNINMVDAWEIKGLKTVVLWK